MSVLDKEKPPVIDDTIPLTCVITGTETVQSHTVSDTVFNFTSFLYIYISIYKIVCGNVI